MCVIMCYENQNFLFASKVDISRQKIYIIYAELRCIIAAQQKTNPVHLDWSGIIFLIGEFLFSRKNKHYRGWAAREFV